MTYRKVNGLLHNITVRLQRRPIRLKLYHNRQVLKKQLLQIKKNPYTVALEHLVSDLYAI